MKKSLLFFVLMCQTVFSADIWFTWKHNPAHELVSSYKIEYVKLPIITNWTHLVTINGTTNVTLVKGVQGGFTYKFRIFAQNSKGLGTNESDIIEIPTNRPSAVVGYQLTNSVK